MYVAKLFNYHLWYATIDNAFGGYQSMSSLSCDYYMNDVQNQSILRQYDVTIALSDLARGTDSQYIPSPCKCTK